MSAVHQLLIWWWWPCLACVLLQVSCKLLGLHSSSWSWASATFNLLRLCKLIWILRPLIKCHSASLSTYQHVYRHDKNERVPVLATRWTSSTNSQICARWILLWDTLQDLPKATKTGYCPLSVNAIPAMYFHHPPTYVTPESAFCMRRESSEAIPITFRKIQSPIATVERY